MYYLRYDLFRLLDHHENLKGHMSLCKHMAFIFVMAAFSQAACTGKMPLLLLILRKEIVDFCN